MELPAEFIKIPIILLIAESPALMDIHLFMPLNSKVMLYRKAGDFLSLDDVMHLRAGTTLIVMRQAEYDTAMRRLSGVMTHVTGEGNTLSAPTKELARNLVRTMDTKDPNAPAEVKRAALDGAADLAKFVLTSASFPQKSSYYETILSELKGSDPFSTHNRHVGALAAMLLMALGGFTKDDVTDIAFAGFFHDIFIRELPKTFTDLHLQGNDLGTLGLRQPVFEYYRHISMVLEKFAAEKVPASAAAMRNIVQHHENYDGSGLKGARGEAIYRPARLLRIADDMICLVNSPTKQHSLSTAFACLENFNEAQQRPIYDPELLTALQPLFG